MAYFKSEWSRTTTIREQGESYEEEEQEFFEDEESGYDDMPLPGTEDCDKENPWDNPIIAEYDNQVRISDARETKHRTRLQKHSAYDEGEDHDSSASILGRRSIADDYSFMRWCEDENEADHELTPEDAARAEIKEIVHGYVEELSDIDNDMIRTKYGNLGKESDLAEKYDRHFQSINRTIKRIRTRIYKRLKEEHPDLLEKAGYTD